MPDDKYEALRMAAEAATPGPWEQFGGNVTHAVRRIGSGWSRVIGCDIDHHAGVLRIEDADYIALANPDTILALLDKLDKLQEACVTWEERHTAVKSKNARLLADLDNTAADRDSWMDQASSRVNDWYELSEENKALLAERDALAGQLEVFSVNANAATEKYDASRLHFNANFGPNSLLYRFLGAAGGEGYVLGGVDAGDLFVALYGYPGKGACGEGGVMPSPRSERE